MFFVEILYRHGIFVSAKEQVRQECFPEYDSDGQDTRQAAVELQVHLRAYQR